jgi:hypothetical protein
MVRKKIAAGGPTRYGCATTIVHLHFACIQQAQATFVSVSATDSFSLGSSRVLAGDPMAGVERAAQNRRRTA